MLIAVGIKDFLNLPCTLYVCPECSNIHVPHKGSNQPGLIGLLCCPEFIQAMKLYMIHRK